MIRKGLSLLTLALFATLPVHGQAPDAYRDADTALADIAREISGFAGYYVAEDGTTVVRATDLTRRADLERIVGPDRQVRLEGADFPFDALYDARIALTDVLAEPGAVYLDIDEVRNRVVVGIDQDRSRRAGLLADEADAPRAIADRFGVDPTMIEVLATAPIVDMVTLRNRVRPAPGGMQINFGNFLCTMGFVIKQGTTNGFITNSHCTNTQGGVESTAYFQPSGANNRIATERKDPTFAAGGPCPPGRLCRFSDSALARFQNNNANLGQFGKVAKPNSSNTGSITIGNGGNARFSLTGEGSAAVGQTVRKVGRTTGWTQGRVSNTCVQTNNENNKTFYCQTFVTAGVGGGDSGSGVLQGRRAVGLLWGGNLAGTLFVYSPLNQVEQELGGFRVQ